MASRSLNKVILIGNLTRDPELRYTAQGTPVCTFGVATNRSWTTDTGEKREETEFHRIVAWRKLAELCGQLLSKGRKVYLEGRLQTRSWTDATGNQRTTTEIVIDDMIILDSRRAFEESHAAKGEEASASAEPVAAAPQEPAVSEAVKPAATPAPVPDDKKKKKKKEEVKTEEAKEKTQEAAEEKPKEELNLDDIPF